MRSVRSRLHERLITSKGIRRVDNREQSQLHRGRFPGRIEATDIVWLTVALIIGVGARVAFINLPMIHDEGGYALAARGWLEGTGRLYGDLWISRPQGIFAIYALTMKTLGYGAPAFRLMALIFASFTTIATWLFARRWTTPQNASLAAIVCSILLGAPMLEGFTANAEVFSGMPAAFAAFWLLRQAQTGWTAKGLLGIGVLIGLSTILKPSGATGILMAAAFLYGYTHDSRRIRLQRFGWVLGGMAAVGIVTLLDGATLGWDNFWYATVEYRFRLQSAVSVGLKHNVMAILGMLYHASAFFLLIIMVLIFRARLPLERIRWRSSREARLLAPTANQLRGWQEAGDILLWWWMLAAALGVMMGGDYWTHYLIQMVPPVSLWLARASSSIVHALRGWRRPLSMAMFALLLLVPYGVIADGADGIYQHTYRHPGYPAQAEVARYIREHTTPNQTIYVAFDQASIYYLADRKPAYRHLYDQELRALPNSYGDIISIISSDERPVYIVSTLHPGPFPDDSRAFWREVSRYYDLETMIDGVPIYRAKPGLRHSGDDQSTDARWALPLLGHLVADGSPGGFVIHPPRPGFPSAPA